MKTKRPTDINQLAKAIVVIATGDVQPGHEESAKTGAGRKGGLKGGAA